MDSPGMILVDIGEPVHFLCTSCRHWANKLCGPLSSSSVGCWMLFEVAPQSCRSHIHSLAAPAHPKARTDATEFSTTFKETENFCIHSLIKTEIHIAHTV